MRHWIIALACVAGTTRLAAQDCTEGHLPNSSNEAEIFRIRGASTVFSRAASPMALRRGSVVLLFEGSSLPNIDAGTRTPSYCRPGKPPEHVNLLPVFPRPRAIFGLDDEMSLEVSWVPPIRLSGVKANLVGVALARTVAVGNGLLSLRGNAVFGEIRAPITCTKDQIAQDTTVLGATECAGGAKPSDDHFKPNSFGVDMTYGWPVGSGKFRPYLGAGVNWLRSRFQVDFDDRFGVHQGQKVEGDYTRLGVFAGASWFPIRRWGLTGELFADPGTTWVGRMGLAYGLK